jgi:hypothetical protein
MANPTITTKDLETGEEVTRPMTNAEFAQYKKDREADAQYAADLEAKAAAKQALLDRLGLTEEEFKLLTA